MFTAIVFSLLVIAFWVYRCLHSPVARIPGPFYSTFTSFWLKYKEFSRGRRIYIHKLHQEYGLVVRLGPNEISFAAPDAVKEIYTSGSSGYDRTEFYDLFIQFETRTLFSTPPKYEHSQRKRILADRYANTNIMRPESLQGLQDRARTFVKNCTEVQGDVDAYAQLHCYALDGVSTFLFHPYGTNSLSDPHDLEMMQELSYREGLRRNLLKYYSPFLSSIVERLSSRSRYGHIANDYVLEMSKRAGASPFSLLSKLQTKASELPPLAIPAESMDHLVAGIDTTGDGLCFLMYELSLPRSQQFQKRLQEELLSNLEVPFDQLPYLDAIVKEGLRCFPPIPMSFPRYVPSEGRTISEFWIPGGCIVSSQPYTLHKNELAFPRALEFVPERWLSSAGAAERDEMFFAFSKGSRGCIGKNLAIAEMKILLREVYSQCSTKVSYKMTGDMSPSDQIISSRPRDQTCKLVFEKLTAIKKDA